MAPSSGSLTGEFDYVIVGSGAAGSILASRLSEDPGVSVCVLESGPSDRHPLLHLPAGAMKLLHEPRYVWQLSSESSPLTAGRRIPMPQGRTLGGSTAINGLLYVRGQPEDFDEWAALGNRGWSYSEVLPYFMRNESWRGGGDDRYRGRSGPQAVTEIEWVHPLNEAFIAGAVGMGLPRNPDYNGTFQSGVGYYQRTILGRWRVSTGRSYLASARHRPNLAVMTQAHVVSVEFEGKRAAGVRYVRADASTAVRRINARREVILCCGALNTPKLLQLSGVGPAEVLRPFGIPVVADLPGVGRGLRDHYSVRLVSAVSGVRSINEMSRGVALWWQVMRWALGKTNILALSPALVYVFWNTQTGGGRPDLQGVFTPASLGDRPGMLDTRPAATCGVWQHRPFSRGTVEVRSTDALEDPLIHPNYLEDERDQEVLLKGIRLARRLLSTPEIAHYVREEIRPGPDVNTDQELLAYARQYGASSFHFNGTARMGLASDRNSVVDDHLRVHGVTGLRVVDASIMPTTPSANTCAPTMMIAEKAADLIRGDGHSMQL